MSILVAYPYDPAGTRDECHLQDESHVILTNDNSYRVIVPELAPFFKHDLSVIHTASGLELKEGKDYNLGYKLLSAKKIAQRDLYGAIVIINPQLKGEFFVSYRSVGGNFVGIRSEVVTYLANALNDPTRTPFDKVIDRPSYFTPPKHEQHYSDFLNKEYTEDAIDDLVSAIDAAIENVDGDAIGYLNSRIQQLDSLLNQHNQAAHIVDYSNPHGTTAEQVQALPQGNASVDTFKAYNLTLVELANYINDRGITQDDVERYLSRYGDQFYSDKLILKDGQAVIRSESGTTSIDLSNGNVVIKADTLNTLHADSDIHSVGETMSLIAGANTLEVISSGSGGREVDKLEYNGHEVIHGGTVREKLKEKGGIGMRVVTQNTDTVQWEGTSRPSDKLKANVVISIATLTKRGSITLSNSRTENSRIKAPTPFVLNEIRKDGVNRVNKSTTVNGYPLTSNFSLDKDDVNLNKVDNTADKDKPVSSKQQKLLDEYSNGIHQHNLSEMDLPIATRDTLGVVTLVDDIESAFSEGGAATPKTVEEYVEHIVNVATISEGKLPSDVLDVRYWGPISPITCTGLTIDFPAGAYLYLDRVNYTELDNFTVNGDVIDFAAEFPNAYLNETFYIYIEVVTDGVKHVARKELVANAGPRIHIATVKVGSTEILNVSEVNGNDNHIYDNNVDGILEVDPVTSVGMFRELEEHEADETAHIGDGAVGDASTIGLDLIKNYPVVNYSADASHSGVDEWDMFTGWDVNAKDAATALPITVRNGNIDVSNGIKLTVPWNTGGNQLLVMRNNDVGMNDPKYVSDEIVDGVRKRKIGFLLTSKYTPSVTSVKRWHALIGSHTDEVGDVHDVMVHTAEQSGSVNQAASVIYYKNGVYVATLATTTSGTWMVHGGHERTYLIFEYWETADGFDYAVEIHHDGYGQTRNSNSDAFKSAPNVAVHPGGSIPKWGAFDWVAPTSNEPASGSKFFIRKEMYFEAGTYVFRAFADDVLHVWIDEDKLDIAQRTDKSVVMTEGFHTVTLYCIDVGVGLTYAGLTATRNGSLYLKTDVTWKYIRATAGNGYSENNLPQVGAYHGGEGIARSLDRQRVQLSFKDDAFDMQLLSERYEGGERLNSNTASIDDSGYVNGNVKKAIQSGTIGFGAIPTPAAGGDTPSALSMDIDCIAADEGSQDEKYITAKGVYQSLRDGVNLITASGSVTSGSTLPALPNCRYTNVYLGIGSFGSSANNTDVIDGIDFKLMSAVNGEEIPNRRLDMLSIHRYGYPKFLFKTESQSSSGTPTKVGACNYMLVGLRDI